ncbi:class I SAM-dependent methyltransferase [Tsukamurella soli]|uniref:S-adenosyl-L-methionine-dependent methyltransferase n=1 Tax=Tsukamurella soli TaxID=644556 RepID=A0ABP8JY85_9ACTN
MEAEASRTAVLVCQARAVADGRLAVGRFSDPFAIRLLQGDERAPVERTRASVRGPLWTDRVQDGMVAGTATVLATRTVAIDDAVAEAGNPQLVLLGAGLDARAYRLGHLAHATVFEVDHPLTQQAKRARTEGLTPVAGALTYVPVDFRHDSLAAALAEAGHDPDLPTTWIWEGVLPYLAADAVASTLSVVEARSAPDSRLVATYSTSNAMASIASCVFRAAARLFGARDPLENEPHVSAWSVREMRTLLESNGFHIEDDRDMAKDAERLAIPTRRIAKHMGRVVVARR